MSLDLFSSWLVPVFLTLAALALGFLLGRFAGGRRGSSPAKHPTPSVVSVPDDDTDEPTAPIAPMVEMARSPHDRHRDLAVGRALVKRIDLLDDMVRHAARRRDSRVEEQLSLLRRDLVELLRECSVESFHFSDGDVVTADMRREIQIVGGKAVGERTVISETVLCGFRYRHDAEETMILRKAEVVIR